MYFILVRRLILYILVVLHITFIPPRSPLLLRFRILAQRPNEPLHLYNIGEVHLLSLHLELVLHVQM
jgi:hypothetical protein